MVIEKMFLYIPNTKVPCVTNGLGSLFELLGLSFLMNYKGMRSTEVFAKGKILHPQQV